MVDAMAAFLWHDPSNEIGDTIKIITSKGMVYLWAVNRTFLTGKGRTSVLCLEVGINPRTELEPDDFKQYIELNWVDDVFPV